MLLTLAGCAALMRPATSRFAQNLSTAILDQNDPPTVREGAPAYLLAVDGLIQGDPDDTGLLLNVGGGVEVYLDEDITLGSTIMFNAMPGKVLGDRSFLSWQILQFQFRF